MTCAQRALGLVAVAVGLLFAPSLTWAGCSKVPLSRTQPLIRSFLIRPEGFVERYPGGGRDLAGLVRDLITADAAATLDPLLKSLRAASRIQKRSVGEGLSIAVLMCNANGDSSTARRIQDAMRRQSDADLSAGYSAGMGSRMEDTPVDRALPSTGLNGEPRGRFLDPKESPFAPQTLPNPREPIR